MARLSNQSHQRRIMVAMAIYVAVLLWTWPLARVEDAAWLKTAYALAPVLPILYVIGLMARRILGEDELEQRTHLIGLGVAAAVTSIFGIVTGFLATANVLPPDWAAVALVWIFPLMMIVYAMARGAASRHYGGGACDDDGMPRAVQFLYIAAIFVAIAAYVYFRKGDEEGAGFASGMAAGMFGCAIFFAIRQRLRRRSSQE